MSSDLAVCQICGRQFTEDDEFVPRILTECGHSLCTGCIRKIKKEGDRDIVCPYCRVTSPVKDNDVKNLKKNFSILQIKENEKYRKEQRRSMMSQEKKERKNDGTCDENSSHFASSFCETCDADLCDECWDDIHEIKILQHHGKTSLYDKPIETIECSIHPGQLAAFVCKDDDCRKRQKRLMCHLCFADNGTHHEHGYILLQTEVVEIRFRLIKAVKVAQDKEEIIRTNLAFLKEIVDSHSSDGSAFNEKYLELIRFRSVKAHNDTKWFAALQKTANARIDIINQRIAKQKTDMDWIAKNKSAIETFKAMPNLELVDKRFQADLIVERIEVAPVNHPNSLVPCSQCIVRVPSTKPLVIEMKPPYRLDIREPHQNRVTTFIEQNSTKVSPKTNTIRYKQHFLRLINRTEDIKTCSEGLCLILVVDPFNGDLDRQYVALQLLENAHAYERIVVGLLPFNFQTISTFLAKLREMGEADPRIEIVYLNDPETDIEKMVDLSFI